MGCTNSKFHPTSPRPTHKKSLRIFLINSYFKQLEMLQLIFRDVSERNAYRKINVQDFCDLFSKAGLWAEYLFSFLNTSFSKSLSKEQFIKGLLEINKSSFTDKAMLLFTHFLPHRAIFQDGLTFLDFIRILLNRRKQEIQEILNCSNFLQAGLQDSLLNCQKVQDDLDNEETHEESFRVDEVSQPIPHQDNSTMPSQKQLNRSVQKVQRISFTFDLNNKSIKVKAPNIDTLVKRYALMTFHRFQKDPKYERLSFENILAWLLEHNQFHSSYFGGFYEELWRIENGQLGYLNAHCKKQSQAYYKINKQRQKKIELCYISNFLIIFENPGKQKIIETILLKGLQIEKYEADNEKERYFGIKISHKHGIYNERFIFFQEEETVYEWLKCLSAYKKTSFAQQFNEGKIIAERNSSEVYECEEKSSGKKFAVKEVALYKLSNDQKQILQNQITIRSLLDHPCFSKTEKMFETKTHKFIVLELFEGLSMREYLKKRIFLSEQQVRNITKKLLKGIESLHDRGIVHQGINPDNILVKKIQQKINKFEVKIIGFDYANFLEKINREQSSSVAQIQDRYVMENVNYLPLDPDNSRDIDEKIDSFSIGATVYFMLAGHELFQGETSEQLSQIFSLGPQKFFECLGKNASTEVKDLMGKLLHPNPRVRISLRQALKHEWLSEQDRTSLPTQIRHKPFASVIF